MELDRVYITGRRSALNSIYKLGTPDKMNGVRSNPPPPKTRDGWQSEVTVFLNYQSWGLSDRKPDKKRVFLLRLTTKLLAVSVTLFKRRSTPRNEDENASGKWKFGEDGAIIQVHGAEIFSTLCRRLFIRKVTKEKLFRRLNYGVRSCGGRFQSERPYSDLVVHKITHEYIYGGTDIRRCKSGCCTDSRIL